MLQQQDGVITEHFGGSVETVGSLTVGSLTTLEHYSTNGLGQTFYNYYRPEPIYWQSYPVYICTDKTKKAIEVLKALQADKMLTCNSVARFIELVEKISNIL